MSDAISIFSGSSSSLRDILLSGGIGVFGAILGASVAGFWTDRSVRRARAADQKERDQISGLHIGRQLMGMMGAGLATLEDIVTAKNEQAKNGGPLSSLLGPRAEYNKPYKWSRDELYVAHRCGGDEFLAALWKAETSGVMYCYSLKRYNDLFESTRSRMLSHSTGLKEGRTWLLTPKIASEVDVRQMMMDDLIRMMDGFAQRLVGDARQALGGWLYFKLDQASDESQVIIETSSGSEHVVSAKDRGG